MTNARVISDMILLKARITDAQVFGQNLLKPSYIAGLGQSLVDSDGFTPLSKQYFDLPNLELTTVGYGIGRAMRGENSICVVKQQDFLYLALDQFINTLGNLQLSDKPAGFFTIICLVSDMPFEGTQAYSNNMSIFENCSEHIVVNYCSNLQMFENSLVNKNKLGVNIIFISTQHLYGQSDISEQQLTCLGDGIFLSENTSNTLSIIFGLVENRHLQQLPKSDRMFLSKNFHDSMVDNILRVVKSRKYRDLLLVDASSSYHSSIFNCYYLLKSTLDDEIHIDILRLRGLNGENLQLIQQSR